MRLILNRHPSQAASDNKRQSAPPEVRKHPLVTRLDMNPRRGPWNKTSPADLDLARFPAPDLRLPFREIGEQRILPVSASFDTLYHGKRCCGLPPPLDGRRLPEESVAASAASADTGVLAVIGPLSTGVDDGLDPTRHRHARGMAHSAGHAQLPGRIRTRAPVQHACRHGLPQAASC